MKTILNYEKSPHFESRANERGVGAFLISMCLGKGVMKNTVRGKIEFTLFKDRIREAIDLDYLKVSDCLAIISMTIVAKENILITVFVKYGDTGINY